MLSRLLLTTILDLAGLVLVVAGLALAAAVLFVPAGFVVGGLGLLAVSWLLDRRAQAGRRATNAAYATGGAV